MTVRIFIGLLSLAGLLISGYFAAVYHKLIPDVDRFVPQFCRLEPGACATVLETRQAKVFGVPNFDLGILFYTGLVVSVLLPDVWKELRTMLFFGSIVAVAMGFYLSYSLLFQLKVHCRLCYTSHAINFLIFFLILVTP
jgi:uncharacterized membrane protein